MRALFHTITGGSLAGRLFCMKLNMLIYRGLHQKGGEEVLLNQAVPTVMWVHIWVIGQTNANMLKGYDKIVMDVLCAQRWWKWIAHMEEQCTTSCVPHDLTLSLLRLVLLPGYYFLWQHLSRRGEQRWKDPDRWLLCILWTGSLSERTEKCFGHTGGKDIQSVPHLCERLSGRPLCDLETTFPSKKNT